MTTFLPPVPENVLARLQMSLVRHVRKEVLDRIVAEKLKEVEVELRTRLQPEVDQITVDHIQAVNRWENDKLQLIIGWNRKVTREENIG